MRRYLQDEACMVMQLTKAGKSMERIYVRCRAEGEPEPVLTRYEQTAPAPPCLAYGKNATHDMMLIFLSI